MSTYTRRWIIGGLCAGFCAAACSRSGLSFLALPGGIAILYAARFRRSSYRPTQLRPLCAGIALTLVTATSLTLLFALDRQPPLSAVRGGTAWLREFAMLPVHAILTVGVALVARNTLTRNAAFYGAGLLGLALLVERILLPMHTFPPAPEFVQAIRGEAQEVSVLDMSAGDRSALIRQAFHGKRTISGYPDWASPEVLGYIASTPLLRESAPESISAESVRAYIAQPAAAEMTRRVVDFLDIRYVITDRSDNDYPMALFDNAAPARMIAENDFNWVYALEFTPTSGVWPGGVVIGKAEWSLYLARGWGESARIYEERGGRGVIWPVSPNSSVLFKADRPQAVGMGFETFLPPNAANVRMSVTINNHWFRDVNVPTGRHVFRLAFDDALVRAGLNEVEFRWLYGGELYYWNEHGNIPLDLFCVCGVKEKGEQNVFLKSGSQTVYSSRGAYNVIELSDDGGNVLRSGQFEGITSNQPSGTLAAYIESIPEGRLVAVMGTPNTSEELDQRTIDALGLLGVAFDPRGRTGWSHIAIGRKGMTKGEALETWNDRPVSILAPGRCGFSAFQFFAVSRKKGEMAAANQ